MRSEILSTGRIRSLTRMQRFYREIGKDKMNVTEPPEKEEIEDFWNGIWGKEKELK